MTDVLIVGGGLAGLVRLAPHARKDRHPYNMLGSFEPSPYISCYLWFDRKVTSERFVSHLWSPKRLNYDFYDLSKIRRGWANRPRPRTVAVNVPMNVHQ